MPKLERLRYVSVGPSDARADDLSLPLTDREGEPTDTTLWLRNGGGKSVLLNLFFSSLHPNRRTWQKKGIDLEDYIKRDDRAVVAAQWQLDRTTGGSDPQPVRYATGVMHEYSGTRRHDTDSRLRRLYFLFRVSPRVEALHIEGLPLFTETEDGEPARRTLTNFREQLKVLRDEHPTAEVDWTEKQQEWQEMLDGLGIDPKLFEHQLHMNDYEGAAAELFKGFETPAEFTDFLVELALDLDTPGKIAKNLKKYRAKLRRRVQQYLPERELVEGLLERVEPLAELKKERAEARRTARRAMTGLRQLESTLLSRSQQLQDAVQEAKERGERHRRKADEAHEDRLRHARRAALMRREAWTQAVQHREQARSEAAEKLESAQRKRRLWTIAQPLREARRREQQARQRRRELQRRSEEHSDLLEEVREAAAAYAGVVKARLRDARQTLENIRSREETLQERAGELDEERSRLDTRRGQLESRREELGKRIRQAREALKRLREEGICEDNEMPADAHRRITEALEELDAERAELEEAREQLAERSDEIHASLQEHSEERAAARSRLDQIDDRLQDARQRREELEQDERLRALLQSHLDLNEIDLGEASPELVADLRTEVREELTRLLRLRVDREEQERALQALETRGLLPPPRDVQRVREQLTERGVDSHAGNAYLASVVRDRASARRLIRHRPEVLMSVVVRSQNWEAAQEALDGADLELDAPVPILTPTYFDREDTDEAHAPPDVRGPTRAAHFNEEAGAQAEVQQREAMEETGDRLQQVREERGRLRDAARTLESYFEQWPETWWERTRQARADERERIEELEQTIGELQDRREELVDRRGELKDRREELQSRQQDLRSRRERLQGIRARFPSGPAEMKQQQHELRAELQEIEDRLEEIAGRRRELEETRSTLADRRSQEEARKRERSRDLDGIQYVEPDEVEPTSGDREARRSSYRNVVDTYEERVEAETLRQLAREYETEAGEYREKFREQLDRTSASPELTEAEVRDELKGLEDPDRLDEHRERAEQQVESGQRDATRCKTELKRARNQLEEAETTCRDLGVKDEPVPEDAPDEREALLETADQLNEKAEEAERRNAEHQQKAAEAEQEHQTRSARHQRVQSLAERASSTRSQFEDLLADPLDDEEDAPEADRPVEDPSTAGADELKAALEELSARLRSVRNRTGELNRKRDEHEQTIRRWLGRETFDGLSSPVLRKFRGWTSAELERESERLQSDLETRHRALEGQIEEIDQNREIIARRILDVASDAVRLLESAARRSRVPEEVAGLGGERFLKITVRTPDDPRERERKITNLLDEFARDDRPPTGLEIVQRAVRRLAHPIRVKVLKPSRGQQGTQYRSITRFESMSGGQGLTAAVMLYSTLERLRSRSRGQKGQESGVLVLDNPYGVSSRPKFLELQREVARAMNVQLLYTTAIKDYEAVRMFPHIIRLRNDQIDRRTSDRLLRVDEEAAENTLESVRFEKHTDTSVPAAEPAGAGAGDGDAP